MLNKIWPFFIIVSVVYALFSGKIEYINNEIFESADGAIKLIISLFGTMCLWSGIMNIISNTSIIDKFCNMLNPLINLLFPELKNNRKIKKEISMNMTANFFGLGNAATPLGLKAMDSMKKLNGGKEELSDSMKIFLLINTASIQFIPTTIFSIRKSLESQNPTKILIPVWCSTICAAVCGVLALKILLKKRKK